MTTILKFGRRVKPKDVSIVKYGNIDPDEFQRGYEHGLRSNKLTEFRLSFRLGFREAIMERRRNSNVRSIPCKLSFTAAY